MPGRVSTWSRTLCRLPSTVRADSRRLSILYLSDVLLSSAPGFGLPLGIADTGQRNPRWWITGGKSLDQALDDLVVVRCRRFNFLKRPGIGPAFSASMMVRCHRYPPKRSFSRGWDWPARAVAIEA